MLFPFGNILFPYIYWKLNQESEGESFCIQACNVLNFQLFFTFLVVIVSIYYWYKTIISMSVGGHLNFSFLLYLVLAVLIINFIYPFFVAVRIKSIGKLSMYYPVLLPLFKYKKVGKLMN